MAQHANRHTSSQQRPGRTVILKHHQLDREVSAREPGGEKASHVLDPAVPEPLKDNRYIRASTHLL
jgi:hypothetical protein